MAMGRATPNGESCPQAGPNPCRHPTSRVLAHTTDVRSAAQLRTTRLFRTPSCSEPIQSRIPSFATGNLRYRSDVLHQTLNFWHALRLRIPKRYRKMLDSILHPLVPSHLKNRPNPDFEERNVSLLNELLSQVEPSPSLNALARQHTDFGDGNLSYHYHIFAHLSQTKRFASHGVSILEIGTFRGEFTQFLARIFPRAQISTLDLPTDHLNFQVPGKHLRDFERHLEMRETNLNYPNITFHACNSSQIPDLFEGRTFDLIWIDGDHQDPQVSLDISNSLALMTRDSIMATDDIVMTDYRDTFVSNDSYLRLRNLEKSGVIQNFWFRKRVAGAISEKYIAVSLLR